MTQSWTRLTYLHWPYDPAVVRPFFPRGVEPDVSGGVSWVGLIPFAMRDVQVLGVRVPYVSDSWRPTCACTGSTPRGGAPSCS